jgi:type I restriction enzyme M protein
MIARAHIPQAGDGTVLMGRIWNDGYVKLKSRRVVTDGSQLPVMTEDMKRAIAGRTPRSRLAVPVKGGALLDGAEWSPQQWLPQPAPTSPEMTGASQSAARSIFQAVAKFPDIADEALDDFCAGWRRLPSLPLRRADTVARFFHVLNGRSSGEKNYQQGEIPYNSSGDAANSIVGLKQGAGDERFTEGGLTVTAFGTAALQPWPFLARGNGGSAVRVLLPRFQMEEADLLWFAAQINLQRWRFFTPGCRSSRGWSVSW